MGHLVAGCIDRAAGSRDVREINRVCWVGDVEKRSSVSFDLAVQAIDPGPGMMSHIGDVTIALMSNQRLVGRTAVKSVVSHQCHIPCGLRRSAVGQQIWGGRGYVRPLSVIKMCGWDIWTVRRVVLRHHVNRYQSDEQEQQEQHSGPKGSG